MPAPASVIDSLSVFNYGEGRGNACGDQDTCAICISVWQASLMHIVSPYFVTAIFGTKPI